VARLVVVGAGIVGLCTAEAALRRGFEVDVLERDPVPDGCSFGNGGMLVPSHFVPLAAPGMVRLGLRMMARREGPFGFRAPLHPEVAGWAARFARSATQEHVRRSAPLLRDLNLASLRLYETLFGRYGIDAGLERRGLLMLCRTDAGLAAERSLAESAAELGLGARILDRDALRALEPAAADEVLGGVLFEDDAHLSPPRAMRGLRAALEAAGVRFVTAEANGFARDDARIRAVRSSVGEHEGDEFVLAAGARTGGLARPLGIRLPLLAGRGYGLTLPAPEPAPSFPAILVEDRVALTPMDGVLRVVGTMELGRCHDAPPNAHRLRGLRRALPRYYRDVEAPEGLQVWQGMRPCTPDGLPVLGRPRAVPNLMLATGHGMMGMSLGPVTGELAAQILAGEAPDLPIDLLSPDRFR
jgi:D-amino-acid dehydrogenase